MRASPYLIHLLWIAGVIVLQWIIVHRILRRAVGPILLAGLIGGSYYTLVDMVAVAEGIWRFDETQIDGTRIGPLPIEEVLFFFMTATLVAQSLYLFLPPRLRGRT